MTQELDATMSDRWPSIADAPALALALALAGLGALSLISGDFAFQWQPIDAALPARAQWALATGIVEVLAALMISVPRTRKLGAFVVCALYLFWTLLHTPGITRHPLDPAAWLGAAEPFSIALGSLILLSARDDRSDQPLVPILVQFYGACAVIFGAAHFAYGPFTAAMVPAWLPMPLVLAYLTGSIHAGTGLALIIGFQRAFAAAIEAAMMTSFVLLVHVPRVLRQSGNRLEWTMMFAALALSASAWIVAHRLFALRKAPAAQAALTAP